MKFRVLALNFPLLTVHCNPFFFQFGVSNLRNWYDTLYTLRFCPCRCKESRWHDPDFVLKDSSPIVRAQSSVYLERYHSITIKMQLALVQWYNRFDFKRLDIPFSSDCRPWEVVLECAQTSDMAFWWHCLSDYCSFCKKKKYMRI